MQTIVNNKKIFEDFKDMLCKEKGTLFNTICLYSPKGKGKTTVINLFADYCEENEIVCTTTDFNEDLHSFVHTKDLIDEIILGLQLPEIDIQFNNYEKEVEEWLNRQKNVEVVFEKSIMANTSIGPTIIKPDTQIQDQHYSQTFMKAFLKDIRQIKKKIVIFIDHFELAPEEIQKAIVTHLLRKDVLKPNIFLVFATEKEIPVNISSRKFSHIKLTRLPDEYNYDDWKVFCEKIYVDEELLKPIYDTYKSNPLWMKIALKPHEGKSIK